MLDQRSVMLAISFERKRLYAELERAREEMAAELAALRAELDDTKLAHLQYRALVTHDKKMLADIDYARQLLQAQCAQRDENTPLQ